MFKLCLHSWMGNGKNPEPFPISTLVLPPNDGQNSQLYQQQNITPARYLPVHAMRLNIEYFQCITQSFFKNLT